MFNFSFNNDKHKFGNIELDALLNQKITLKNIISNHPLEDGTILNDAIHNQPLEMSFTAIISDLPQTLSEQLSSISDSISFLLDGRTVKTSKSLKAWQDIFSLWKSKTLVTISSPIQKDVFEDMGILEIGVDLDSTESITLSVNLKQVEIIENINKKNLAPEIGKQSIRL